MGRRVKVPFRVRYRTSRAIMGASLRLMRRERDLWVFPILAAIVLGGCIAVPAGFLGRAGYGWAASLGVPQGLRGFAVGLAILPLLYPFMLLTTLFNAALCFCAHERLEGREGSLRSGWGRALSRIGPIARFNLIAMVVAGLLQVVGLLLERLRLVPYLGQVVQLVGMYGWAAASFFVIPVLVVEEEKRAIGALRSSLAMARAQWGKTTAGIVTIGLAVVVPMMVAMLLIMAGIAVWFSISIASLRRGATMDFLPIWLALGALGVVFLLVMALSSAATGLYQTALYRYARTGAISAPYDEATLVDAWTPYRGA